MTARSSAGERAPVREHGGLAIHCSKIEYRYPNGAWGSRGIDLEVRSGELFCLLGENGAGKTTLLRLITGELTPDAGEVRVLGRSPSAAGVALKRELGVIPQSVGLFDGLEVERHLRLFAPLKGVAPEAARLQVETLLRICGLEPIRKRRVGEISGGQRRKVLVALALLGEPSLLVLDEPTVGLDPAGRRTVWEIIRRQRDRGTTILLTTHYLDEAEKLSDRLGIVQAGRIRRTGTLAELLRYVDRSHRLVVHEAPGGPASATHWFGSLEQAHAFARERRLESFSVAPVSLEDAYLQLIERFEELP